MGKSFSSSHKNENIAHKSFGTLVTVTKKAFPDIDTTLLFFLIFTVISLLFYRKPLFTSYWHPDEYFHIKRSYDLVKKFHLENDYPPLCHIICVLGIILAGLWGMRLILVIITFLEYIFYFHLIYKIFGKRTAIIGTFALLVVFPSPLVHLFRIGTFSNLIGDLFSLLLLYTYFNCTKRKLRLFLLFFLAFLMALSHTLTLITVAIIFVLSTFKNKITDFVIVASGYALAAFPFNLFRRVLFYARPHNVHPPILIVKPGTTSSFLDLIPYPLKPLFLHFPLAQWHTWLTLAGLLTLIFFEKNRKEGKNLIMFILIIFICFSYALFTFNGTLNLWRIDLEFNFLKSFFFGYFLARILQFLSHIFNTEHDVYSKYAYLSLNLLLLFSIFYIQVNLPQLLGTAPYWYCRQTSVYDSILWLESNRPNCRILSLAVFEYYYVSALSDKLKVVEICSVNMSTLLKMALQNKFDVLVVFKWDYRYTDLLKSQLFTKIYENSGIGIFEVNINDKEMEIKHN